MKNVFYKYFRLAFHEYNIYSKDVMSLKKHIAIFCLSAGLISQLFTASIVFSQQPAKAGAGKAAAPKAGDDKDAAKAAAAKAAAAKKAADIKAAEARAEANKMDTPPDLQEYDDGTGEEEEPEPEAETQPQDPIDREIEFMKGLIRMRFPDYSQKVLDKLLLTNPDAKPRAGRIKIDILAGTGRYADAEKLIASMPQDSQETWGMKLALAGHYYEVNRMTEAKAGYEAFFSKYTSGPPKGMEKFYMDQAYMFAQMLMVKNDERAAIDAYGYIIKANPPKDIEFKIRVDLAELCIKMAEKAGSVRAAVPAEKPKVEPDKPKDPKAAKAGKDLKSEPQAVPGKADGRAERDEFLKKAKEALEPVLWKGQDQGPLFGKALIMLAHIEMIKGDKVAAKKLIDTYLPMLKELERILEKNKISLEFSPMAECRYLLGTINEEQGREFIKQNQYEQGKTSLLAALKEYVNVVRAYPTGQWAMPAGEAQDRVVAFLKSLKPPVEVVIPAFDRKEIMAAQLRQAQIMYEQNDFAGASKKYLAYVNSVPEADSSIAALGELAKCYAELGNTNYFVILVGYIAERFGGNPQLQENAGDAILRAAGKAEEMKDQELRQKAYDYYMEHLKTHRRMAGVIFSLAESKYKEKNYDQAIDQFQQIVTNSTYIKSPVYFPALGRVASCYTMQKDYSNAVQILTKALSELSPGPDEIETKYRLADILRRTDKIVPAINEFVGIINTVNGPKKDAYVRSQENANKTRDILESVYFWKAHCYSLLNKDYPPEDIKKYQELSIAGFTKFVADYPKSNFAPPALSRLGTLLSITGKSDEATKVFDRLVKEYPEAPEAKDVVFQQGLSLIEMKKMDKAIEVFGKMLENDKAFNSSQFLRVGRIMFDEKQYAASVKFYDRAKTLSVKGQVINRPVWEPAVLGIGEAQYEQGNSAEAAKAIEELLKKFPRTRLFGDASFLLGKAYADLGSKEADKVKQKELFSRAKVTIAEGMKPMTNAAMRLKANLQIADVQMLLGDKGAAAASYYRMLFSGVYTDADTLPAMETALEKGLPMLMEKEMYEEVINIGSKYLDTCKRGRVIREVRRMRDDAKLKMAMSGRKMETETGTAPATPAVPAPAAKAEETPAPAK